MVVGHSNNTLRDDPKAHVYPIRKDFLMTLQNVSDYIAEFLHRLDIKNIHTLMGGGASGLNDAFIRNKNINCLSYHHEQAAGYAALGEVRRRKRWAVANVTTGCGGSNIYTPVLNAWQDSLPLLVISGNVPYETLSSTFKQRHNLNLRGYGVQENDIISGVTSITKYASIVTRPEQVEQVMKQALISSATSRKGPAWIDVPADIQHASVSSELIDRIDLIVDEIHDALDLFEQKMLSAARKLEHSTPKSSRPLLLLGGGVSNCPIAKQSVLKFVEATNIPVVATYAGTDIVSHDYDKYLGAVGIKGNRAANFAVQNCDLLIVAGSRLPFAAIGYDEKNFAKNAHIMTIDPDEQEQKKNKILFGDRLTSINTTAQAFFNNYNFDFMEIKKDWLDNCKKIKNDWEIINENISYYKYNGISIYHVMRELNNKIYDNCDFVIDAGSISYVGPTALSYRKGRNFIFSPAQADMGCALPSALGVASVSGNRVICVTGDGSFMSNLQELSTLSYNGYNLTVVLLNNSGYLSISNTQKNNYGANSVYGEHDGRGLTFPDYKTLCKAFNLSYAAAYDVDDLQIIQDANVNIVDVRCLEEETIAPFQTRINGKQAGAHDMAPFKDLKELREMASAELTFIRNT